MDAYDFTARARIADVGGAHGSLLAAVLAAQPRPTGVLVDLPPVIADAADGSLAAFAGRCDLVAGDFFTAVPEADTCLLKMILHDWPDEACIVQHPRRRAHLASLERHVVMSMERQRLGPPGAGS